MCSNIIADYMDDLVDCFEGFIQKSLLAIIVALGIIVASVVYLLKVLSERALDNSMSFGGPRTSSRSNQRSTVSREGRAKSRVRELKESFAAHNDEKQISTALAHSTPSSEENVIRLAGLSCCTKPCCKSKSKFKNMEFPAENKCTIASSEISVTPVVKQEIDSDKQQNRSNSLSPVRSPSPKHSSQSLTLCPKEASQKSCCSMCCNED
ncbi:unnamed protein product [Leptosia nina]|uniref:Uncharacterized protein n=1 Tax=Leptosia nina TaxID=320188 RepID=A0AAV1JFX9_9NEOP